MLQLACELTKKFIELLREVFGVTTVVGTALKHPRKLFVEAPSLLNILHKV